jgi:aspartate racemase
MKTLGLIGGTTWLSTVDYYKYINQITNDRLGGLECARLMLYSLNFGEFMKFVNADDWDSAAQFLAAIAVKLEKAGAEAIVLCANTTHLTAETVQQSIGIPILHIVDAVATEISKLGLRKVGLLGTRFTMERDFFSGRLNKFNIEALIPDEKGREFVHASIYNELGKNIFLDETKKRYLQIIEELRAKGAEGVILGCTEIPLLIKQTDCTVPVLDTTFIHAKYAVDFALSSGS